MGTEFLLRVQKCYEIDYAMFSHPVTILKKKKNLNPELYSLNEFYGIGIIAQ